jgi:hypothetical protein
MECLEKSQSATAARGKSREVRKIRKVRMGGLLSAAEAGESVSNRRKIPEAAIEPTIALVFMAMHFFVLLLPPSCVHSIPLAGGGM